MNKLQEEFDRLIADAHLPEGAAKGERYEWAITPEANVARRGQIVAELRAKVAYHARPEVAEANRQLREDARERADAAEAEAKAKTEAREEAEVQRQEAEWGDVRRRELRAWTMAGGDVAGFDAEWPTIKRRIIQERMERGRRDAYRPRL